MRHLKTGMLLLLLIGLTTACKQQDENKSSSQEPTKTESHQSDEELRLNNGKKWMANSETTSGMLAMQKLISEFKETDNKEYSKLKTQLEQEFSLVIEKCTMKGESHDQLHNYLYPLKTYFSALDKDKESAKEAFSKIESYIPVYFEYFE